MLCLVLHLRLSTKLISKQRDRPIRCDRAFLKTPEKATMTAGSGEKNEGMVR